MESNGDSRGYPKLDRCPTTRHPFWYPSPSASKMPPGEAQPQTVKSISLFLSLSLSLYIHIYIYIYIYICMEREKERERERDRHILDNL